VYNINITDTIVFIILFPNFCISIFLNKDYFDIIRATITQLKKAVEQRKDVIVQQCIMQTSFNSGRGVIAIPICIKLVEEYLLTGSCRK